MPFASYSFCLLFLPATLAVFVALRRRGALWRESWLVAASLLFYAQSSLAGVALLVASAVVNFQMGAWVASAGERSRRRVLWLAVGVDLLVLAIARYAPLLDARGTAGLSAVAMPVAVSFFTFQQISYLVDVYKGDAPALRFLDYAFFVTFFPKLLSGPIARARDLLPQIPEAGRFGSAALAAGLTLFAIGLMKKVLLANNLLPIASTSFSAAAVGPIGFRYAWTGAVAYALGLYFDFSGYADMAVAVAWMFGFALPANFNSPYRAVNIREFWRRWHMTLSNLFFEYVYVPTAMAAGRRTSAGPYVALIVTMLVCGLWHGAAWTYLAWGGLHGGYLVVNYGWRQARDRFWPNLSVPGAIGSLVGVALTFVAVTISWVPFRAESVGSAQRMLGAMLSPVDLVATVIAAVDRAGAAVVAPMTAVPALLRATTSGLPLFWILIGLIIVWAMPNSLAIVPLDATGRSLEPARRIAWWQWRPSQAWGLVSGLVTVASLFFIWGRQVEFVYFKF